MPIALSATVRWFASASIVVLLVLIVLQLASREGPSEEPALLIKSDAAALIVAASPAAASSAAVSPASRSVGSPASASATPSAAATAADQIAVDVIGAVAQPGVYWLERDARVVDLVRAAGGLAPDADREQLNMAAAVADGQQLRVPHVGEVAAPSSPPAETTASTGGAAETSGLIDLNRADAAALDTLSGIGPATAAAIIEYREANGPFKRSEDIQNVKGIGPSVYAKIKDQITAGP